MIFASLISCAEAPPWQPPAKEECGEGDDLLPPLEPEPRTPFELAVAHEIRSERKSYQKRKYSESKSAWTRGISKRDLEFPNADRYTGAPKLGDKALTWDQADALVEHLRPAIEQLREAVNWRQMLITAEYRDHGRRKWLRDKQTVAVARSSFWRDYNRMTDDPKFGQI